jgi:hypothetical protein
LLEHSEKKEKTANDGTRPPLSMIAVEDGYSLGIPCQIFSYLLADGKEYIEWGRFVVFPFETYHIFELALFNVATADVDGHVFILMGIFQQFPNGVD